MEEITAYLDKTLGGRINFHGILASDDLLAIGGMKYIQSLGLDIPEDVSIVGYNNSMLTACCSPTLTSVDNCLEALSHQLIHTLLHVLAGEEMPKKTIFSGKLIQRNTTRF